MDKTNHDDRRWDISAQPIMTSLRTFHQKHPSQGYIGTRCKLSLPDCKLNFINLIDLHRTFVMSCSSWCMTSTIDVPSSNSNSFSALHIGIEITQELLRTDSSKASIF